MKKLIFKRVRYKNIMSVGNKPIDIDLTGFHKTLCTGVNGAGKSTMIEAIYFALSGKPYRNIKKNQLLNSVNKKGLETELWLEFNGDEFYVMRGIKPNKLKITRNGEELNESASVRDFQEYFESLIGMTAASFKQVVVLGTAGYTPFMMLTAQKRRELVEDLLEVSVLSIMDKLNKTRLREITQALQLTEAKIRHLEQQIKTHKEYQAKAKQDAQENQIKYQNMYDALMNKISVLRTDVESMQAQLAALPELQDPYAELMKYVNAHAALNQKAIAYRKVSNMHDAGGTCPTCMQQFDSPHLIQKLTDHTKLIEKKMAEVQTRVDELKQQSELFKKTSEERQRLDLYIRTALTNIQTHTEQASKVQALMNQSTSEFVDKTDVMNKLIDEAKEEISKKSELMVEKYRRSNITELLKDSGVKAMLLKRYIPFFNKRIQHYLNILEADFVFSLDEEFNESIKSRGREDFTYASFSQGEKSRIDLALIFTWRDVASMVSGIDVNMLILDEVMDSAGDQQFIDSLFEIIDSMKLNVYMISHRDHQLHKFNRHVKMEKKGRFSECSITHI